MKKETLDSLKNRRSIRKYKDEQITAEELDLILEAGMYAPTAMGTQSPKMVVVQDKELIAKLSKMNAAVSGSDRDPFYGAPTVVLVFGDGERPNYIQDASLVMANLMLGAYAVGVGSCWINRAKEMFAAEDGKALMKEWGIDEKYIGVACCIMGYADGEAPVAKERKADYVVRV